MQYPEIRAFIIPKNRMFLKSRSFPTSCGKNNRRYKGVLKKEDELLKCYLSDDERYADLINGVSFGGRQVVRAEDLSDRDTQTGYHKNARTVKGKKNTKYRDLFRKASFGANFAVVGIENQKQVHYLMPVRCMEYDLKEYQRQEMEQTDMFHTDLKQVLDVIRCSEDEKKLEELITTDPAYKTVAGDAYDVMAAFVKSKTLVQLKETEEGETIDMCKALQDWAARERREGRQEGRSEGILVGRSEGMLANLHAIMVNLNFTAEKAMDVLNVPQEERAQYVAKLNKC